MTQASSPILPWFTAASSWEERMAFTLETMRSISRQRDPQQMVELYGERMRLALPTDGSISLSRRDLAAPSYRITRSSLWGTRFNPWKQKEKLPIYENGILGELLYSDGPMVRNDIQIEESDPAFEHLRDYRSLLSIPLFDQGIAQNMVVRLSRSPDAFSTDHLPELVWTANLFGIATRSLVMSEQVREAYEAVDREMQAVAEIQRSLLPTQLPSIPTLHLASHYQTSQRAGGDYYDFFPLPEGQWGILIADVSGHGTPAAVLMAITHSIAHTCCDPPAPPGRVLGAINARLAQAYTVENGSFVTAFYAVYDPATRRLTYANAGHPRPRVRRAANHESVEEFDGEAALPLGILSDETYPDTAVQLHPGDTLVFFTDGITEARNIDQALFENSRLDALLKPPCILNETPRQTTRRILQAVENFTDGRAPTDDRTLIVAKVG